MRALPRFLPASFGSVHMCLDGPAGLPRPPLTPPPPPTATTPHPLASRHSGGRVPPAHSPRRHPRPAPLVPTSTLTENFSHRPQVRARASVHMVASMSVRAAKMVAARVWQTKPCHSAPLATPPEARTRVSFFAGRRWALLRRASWGPERFGADCEAGWWRRGRMRQ